MPPALVAEILKWWVVLGVRPVTDPDTYYEPWSAFRRFRRVQQDYAEEVCAENNQHLFDYKIPVANKPDF